LAERLLGRHVRDGAHDHTDARELGRVGARAGQADASDTEVEHLHALLAVGFDDQHHVVGLQIAMHDAVFVRRAKRERDLPSDGERAGMRDRPGVEQCAQALTVYVLEHQVVRAVVELAEVARGGDVGVLDATGGDRLALEASHDLFFVEELAVEHLQRHRLPHVHVFGAIDGAHPALAEQAEDAIALRDQGVGGQNTAVLPRLIGLARFGSGVRHQPATSARSRFTVAV
jgi:hypothetical protein